LIFVGGGSTTVSSCMRCYQRDGRKEPWSLQDADILAAAPGLGIQIQPDYYHASFLPRSTLSQRPADAQFPKFLGSGDPMIDGIFPAVWVPPSPGHCTGVPLNPSGRPRNQTDRCTKDFPWRLPFPEIFDWETVKSTRKIVYLRDSDRQSFIINLMARFTMDGIAEALTGTDCAEWGAKSIRVPRARKMDHSVLVQMFPETRNSKLPITDQPAGQNSQSRSGVLGR
jgi:hypothetical protein